MSQNKWPLRLLAIFIALALWEVAALSMGESLLLVGPINVVKELWNQIFIADFWKTILFSLTRIFAGFFIALILGIFLAALSYKFEAFKIFIWPYIAVIKATPVASIIILILIWLNSESLSVFVSFLIVLPVIYSNFLEGFISTDKDLLEMSKVYDVGFWGKMKYIYMPHLKPYVLSAFTASIGMAWKSGTAAEVIGVPKGSIGERLYEAKIYLSTGELFAWTIVIILLSVVMEKLLLHLVKFGYKKLEES